MRQRLVRSLLVLTLLSSGTSAPFAHVHPPGHDHAAGAGSAGSEISAGEHDARRHWHGIHWHQGERRGPGTSGADIGERVAVALAEAAEAPPVRIDTMPAPAAEALPSATVCYPASRTAPAAACADPDPPPRASRSPRAPPLPR